MVGKIRRFVPLGLLWVGGSALAVAGFFSFFSHSRENARRSSCQSNLKQIGLAFAEYTQDNDGRFPLVVGHAAPSASLITFQFPDKWPFYGWYDALLPYTKSTCITQCPSEATPPSGVASEKGYSDYWMNAHLSGKKNKETNLILMGDGEDGSARYAMNGLPSDRKDQAQEERPFGKQNVWYLRHLGGANYAFADGHIKWFQPDDIGSPQARFVL